MRSLIALALFAGASPALATSTIACRSTISPTNGPLLSLSVGDDGIDQARFVYGDARFTTGGGTHLAQSWIDRVTLRLDIADANRGERLVRLDARRRVGSDYLGLLIHAGRTWRVRCSEEG